ncbi:MAG: hypothetical protein HY782_18155 [Chloroflexi bacterium]|nr:hypothetical protein [Chloroflexota bacterium]
MSQVKKSQAKKTREARVTYRAKRKPQAVRPRAPRPRIRKQTAAAKPLPWEKRIAPTDDQIRDWTEWLNQHEPEFEAKYPGHYLAIWDKRIIGASPNGDETYRLAREVRPEAMPLVIYIPRPEDLPAILTPFPSEMRK